MSAKNSRAADQSITADVVVLAAGTLGSTEILLRSREAGLPVSGQVGERFTGNGDVLAFGFNNDVPINGIGVGEPPAAQTRTRRVRASQVSSTCEIPPISQTAW